MTHPDLPPPQEELPPPPVQPARSEQEDGGDQHMRVLGKMVGTAFMFLGFLQIFLSISGGFELSGAVALLLYFGGVAIWANAVIEPPLIRWGVTIGAIALALGFMQFGEILFWHKQVVFWGTIIIVMYFMFNEPKKPA
jgi:hypothetical protein